MKYVFFIIFKIISLTIISQEILNNRFEEWFLYEPKYWTTSNSFTAQYGVLNVFRDSITPYEGNYSVLMETKQIMGYNIPGAITNANITINYSNPDFPIIFRGGFPFNSKPSFFCGYYKYIPVNNDAFLIQAFLLKTDTSSNTTDTIAKAIFSSSITTLNWEPFKITFNYFSNDEPDTIQIIIFSSLPTNPQPGTKLYIDSLYTLGNYEITPIFPFKNTKYFVQNNILYYYTEAINSCIKIYDISGKKIITKDIYSSLTTIPLNRKGVFILEHIYQNKIQRFKILNN